MAMAKIIDGKQIARDLRMGLVTRVEKLKARGITPQLDVILIGELAPSMIYVTNKQRAALEVGINCTVHRLPEDVSEENVAALIHKLNKEESHGILLQLPVPPQLNALYLLDQIHYSRDVDGLNLVNVGRRTLGFPGLLPCTPKGCLTLIKSVQPVLTGLNALVIGRSDLVGKPMAQLLLRENCTVTQAHIHSRDLPDLCRKADIIVVAIGRPKFIQGDWIKPGAIVIDIGINRVEGKIVGDIDFDSAKEIAGAITPVPGGVGPMTIASLLQNTLEVAETSL